MKRLPLSSVNVSTTSFSSPKNRRLEGGGYLTVLGSGTTRQVSVWMLGRTGFFVLVMLSCEGVLRKIDLALESCEQSRRGGGGGCEEGEGEVTAMRDSS